ncbi:Uncharacterised protein [uncultured archaeon]|nr:Uncharacterised protein [uncultured archaeon]
MATKPRRIGAAKAKRAAGSEHYAKRIISIEEKERLYRRWIDRMVFDRKANVSGACLHFYSNTDRWTREWDGNWFFMDESIRSHGKLLAIDTGRKGAKPMELYDPVSRTLIFMDAGYYGWLKSAALALTGDVLEDNHRIFSVHGALLSAGGKGVSLIGPSGTGKTTLSYGLLLDPCVKLVADDWHFFKFVNGDATGYASEKNTYIRADVASVWKEYKRLLKGAKLDNRGRAVVDVGRAIGKNKLEMTAEMRFIVLLQRDRAQPIVRELDAEEAVDYLVRNDYCNPHTLQSNAWKRKVRKEAFLTLFKRCRILLLNTVETPEQSLQRIKDFVGL